MSTTHHDPYRSFLDHNPSPLIAVTLDGRLQTLNQAALKLLEAQDLEESEFAQVLPPNFVEIIQNCKDAEIGIPVTRMDFNHGSILWTPFFNEELDQVFYSGVDITRMQRNELALIQAKEKAEEGDRLKAAFLNNISHEIRTPLNSLLGFMNLLREELLVVLNEDQKVYFDLIQTNGFRLERTMREILDISHFSSGSYEVNLQEIDIAGLVWKIFSENEPALREKGLNADMQIPDEAILIHSDLYCLSQMITHLMDNAIKYTDIGVISISLKVMEDRVDFRLEDTGPGMDEFLQRHIFVPFSQGSMGYSKHYQGIGLGLALVRAYADTISATIDLDSEPGQGSRYQIIIPTGVKFS